MPDVALQCYGPNCADPQLHGIFCKRHWYMVPAEIRTVLRAEATHGAPHGNPVSERWLDAAAAALAALAAAEGTPIPNWCAARLGRPAPHPLDGLLGLSIRQPHAHLLATGVKVVENRREWHAAAKIGLPVAIYASPHRDPTEELTTLEHFRRLGVRFSASDSSAPLARGAVIGLAVLAQVIDTTADPERLAICAVSDLFVEGPIILCFDGAFPIAPIQVRSDQFLWQLDSESIARVRTAFDAPGSEEARARFIQALRLNRAASDVPPWRIASTAIPSLQSTVTNPGEVVPPSAIAARGLPTLHAPGLRLLRRGVDGAARPELPRAWEGAPAEGEIVLLDTETTGRGNTARLVEISLLRVREGVIVDEFVTLVDPGIPIQKDAMAVHGIRDIDVRGAPQTGDVLAEILPRLTGARVVAHNEVFDRSVLVRECLRVGLTPPASTWYCTLKIARRVMPPKTSCALGSLVTSLGVETSKAHRAEDDTRMLLRVLLAMAKKRPAMDLLEFLHIAGAPYELDGADSASEEAGPPDETTSAKA